MKKTGVIFFTLFLFCMMMNGCSNERETYSENVAEIDTEESENAIESKTEADTDAEESKEPIEDKLEVDIPDDFVLAGEEELLELPNTEDLMDSEIAALESIGVQVVESVSYGNYEKLGPVYMIDAFIVTDLRRIILKNQYISGKWEVIYIDDAETGNMYYPTTGKNAYDYLSGECINPASETPEPETGKAEEEAPHREDMYGISNKSIYDVDGNFSTNEVRNDTTGKWKISTISADVQMVDYALSYYEYNFGNDDEVHWIVNFYNKTTTCITTDGIELYVDVHEYVSGEEHDANELGGGMLLEQYFVYLDNGDIEKIQ